MTKMSLLKNKLNDYIQRSESMSEDDLREVVIFILEISNKHIDKSIEQNEDISSMNIQLHDHIEGLELIIGAFGDFLEIKSLDKEFKFYMKGIDAS